MVSAILRSTFQNKSYVLGMAVIFFWKRLSHPVFPGGLRPKGSSGFGSSFAIRGWREGKGEIIITCQMFPIRCIFLMIKSPAGGVTGYTGLTGTMTLAVQNLTGV